jgi:hypothetical protein
MTIDPRIELEHFKRVLKDYNYNALKIQQLNKELARIDYELDSVSGVDPSKDTQGDSYNSGAKSNRWYELLEEEDSIIKERDEFKRKNQNIDRILSMMPKEEETLIRDAYINYKTVQKAAEHYHYNPYYMYEKIDAILIKIFK